MFNCLVNLMYMTFKCWWWNGNMSWGELQNSGSAIKTTIWHNFCKSDSLPVYGFIFNQLFTLISIQWASFDQVCCITTLQANSSLRSFCRVCLLNVQTWLSSNSSWESTVDVKCHIYIWLIWFKLYSLLLCRYELRSGSGVWLQFWRVGYF